ncbi:sporulation protein YlmC with PRC-barrel domain [Roseovarius sp. MBR-51]
MKRILATTAIVALTAMPVFAQSETTDQTAPSTTQSSDTSSDTSGAKANANADVTMDLNGLEIGASDLIGKTVYMQSEDAPDAGIVDTIAAPSDDWENVGEVNDVILSKDGQIESITLDVGGFLGIGGKELSTSMDQLKMVTEEGSEDEYFVVFTGDRAALEEREELDRQSVLDEGGSFFAGTNEGASSENNLESDTMASDTDANAEVNSGADTAADTGTIAGTGTAVDTGTNADATTNADAGMSSGAGVDADANAEATANAEAEDMPGLTDAERNALTAEDLTGVAIYGADDEHVGEISDIVLTDDGKVEHVIVDVGGFLGMGEKPVAVSFDDINLTRDQDGVTNALQATTSLSAEDLENMQEWEG